MDKSKQTNASEGEDGVDLIRNLPDHVLQLILSGIPSTEEVIRTSILSRRWRHLWTSIPSIDIDYTRGLDPDKELESNGFKEFVYWVLLNKTLDLDSFRLCCADYYDMSTIRRWIHAAVVRKVKLLDLMFSPIDEPEDLEIPHCMVTCSSLEVLRLCLLGYRRLCLPKIPGFPALRVLELNDVVLSDIYRRKGDLVKYFLESCPLLEDLSLLNCCTPSGSLVIASPKLKNLRIEKQEMIPDPEVDDMLDCLGLEISCPNLELLNAIGQKKMSLYLYLISRLWR
ncbi:unnamed protein product [Lactuca saligna]|nr:unnamed protein product [Lactuca saligna]